MGKYHPAGPSQKKTITDTLVESEYEHYLDCPNADFITRLAACFLDFIFWSIAWSAANHLSNALQGSEDSIMVFLSPQIARWTLRGLHYCIWLGRVGLVYLYFIWAVASYGGTPGKLLFGLRVLDMGNGHRLSFPRVLFREGVAKAISVASVIGLLLPLFRADRRAFHDLITRSVVKRTRGEP